MTKLSYGIDVASKTFQLTVSTTKNNYFILHTLAFIIWILSKTPGILETVQ